MPATVRISKFKSEKEEAARHPAVAADQSGRSDQNT